eukprot:m.27412 g.27412  ORF g.27412 m.27412 type:complete len:349 (-) comp15743_c0_seq1:119-1165(-)
MASHMCRRYVLSHPHTKITHGLTRFNPIPKPTSRVDMFPRNRHASHLASTLLNNTTSTSTMFSNDSLEGDVNVPEPRSYAKTVPAGLPTQFQKWRLCRSWDASIDSKILRFELPQKLSALGAPSGVKIRQEVNGQTLAKSFSPITHPDQEYYVDFLVKAYREPTSEGLGAFLCDMKPNATIDIKLKPQKLFSGQPFQPGRWKHLALVGNGTGIAPLYQMALASLLSPDGRDTRIWFVSCHRSEEEFLLGDELACLEHKHPHRFFHTRVLSNDHGRISLKHVSEPHFPAIGTPTCTRVVVCGTDGFLDTVSGSFVRVPVEGKSKLKKLQGPLMGLLAQAGFVKNQVTKL